MTHPQEFRAGVTRKDGERSDGAADDSVPPGPSGGGLARRDRPCDPGSSKP